MLLKYCIDTSLERPGLDSQRDLARFGVRVTSSGLRSFFVMTRVRGTLKRLTLGQHPTLRLVEARTLARGNGHGTVAQ